MGDIRDNRKRVQAWTIVCSTLSSQTGADAIRLNRKTDYITHTHEWITNRVLCLRSQDGRAPSHLDHWAAQRHKVRPGSVCGVNVCVWEEWGYRAPAGWEQEPFIRVNQVEVENVNDKRLSGIKALRGFEPLVNKSGVYRRSHRCSQVFGRSMQALLCTPAARGSHSAHLCPEAACWQWSTWLSNISSGLFERSAASATSPSSWLCPAEAPRRWHRQAGHPPPCHPPGEKKWERMWHDWMKKKEILGWRTVIWADSSAFKWNRADFSVEKFLKIKIKCLIIGYLLRELSYFWQKVTTIKKWLIV